jgi:hypothetical protein
VVLTNWLAAESSQDVGVVNKASLALGKNMSYREARNALRWCFYYDDVLDSLGEDLAGTPGGDGAAPAWASVNVPPVIAAWCMSPGAIAPEAAGVTVPVLVAMGERDVCSDPKGEPRAYPSATSVDLYSCPRDGSHA